jgi:hypothetical protein
MGPPIAAVRWHNYGDGLPSTNNNAGAEAAKVCEGCLRACVFNESLLPRLQEQPLRARGPLIVRNRQRPKVA